MNELEKLTDTTIESLDTLETNIQDEEIESLNIEQNINEEIKQEEKVDTPQIEKRSLSISMIENYGENLSEKEFVTDPAIGREEEINQMILALITPDKGALLVGKPGIGKTAIVEGLGYRINKGIVPDALKGWSILKVNITSLLGSTNDEKGNNESNIELLIRELKEKENTILFIDEVHLLVNRNTSNNSIDIANMLKPVLDRGTIKMIGATTTEEYEQYVLRDRAFLRRFIKIDIAEADQPTVVKILMGTYPKFEKKLGVKMAYSDFQKEQIFTFLVDMTSEYKRVYEVAARYPDVTLTVLANAFSYAVFENSKEVRIKHIYKAICNTKNIYPDTLKKEIIKFKEQFKELLEEEYVEL